MKYKYADLGITKPSQVDEVTKAFDRYDVDWTQYKKTREFDLGGGPSAKRAKVAIKSIGLKPSIKESMDYKSLIESSKSSEEILKLTLREAKVGNSKLSLELIKGLKSAGFVEMVDFRGYADAPKGTYTYESRNGNVSALVSPYPSEILVEIYWYGDGQSNVATWGKSSSKVLPKLKSLLSSLSKAKDDEDFSQIAKKYSPDQQGF